MSTLGVVKIVVPVLTKFCEIGTGQALTRRQVNGEEIYLLSNGGVMYRVETLSDKGFWHSDGLNFPTIDEAAARAEDSRWIIVEWRVIDEKGAEVKRGYSQS
jgi:hypothetical protein